MPFSQCYLVSQWQVGSTSPPPWNWTALGTVSTDRVWQRWHTVTSETTEGNVASASREYLHPEAFVLTARRLPCCVEAPTSPRRHCLERPRDCTGGPAAPRWFSALLFQPQPLWPQLCTRLPARPRGLIHRNQERKKCLSHDGQASWRPDLGVFWLY